MSPEEEEDWEVPDPTFIERIIGWGKILWTVKKTVMILLGIGAVSVGGNVAEVNPWKEAAIEIVLTERDAIPEDAIQSVYDPKHEHNMDHRHPPQEFVMPEHSHPQVEFTLPKHTHAQVAHSHQYAEVSHSHPLPPAQDLAAATKEFIAATVKTQIEILVPPDHLKLH